LQCPNCDYKGIEVDLGLHIYEKHRDYLRQPQRDSSDFNIRTDYVIEQIKLQQQGIRIENRHHYYNQPTKKFRFSS